MRSKPRYDSRMSLDKGTKRDCVCRAKVIGLVTKPGANSRDFRRELYKHFQVGIQSIQEVVMMAPKLLVACIALALSSCAANVPGPVTTRNSELTHGNVQMNLKVGETTQAKVLEVFGAPNITTIDASGREVWTYQRHATVAQSSSGKNYWTILLAGGSQSASGFEQSSRTITLIIKFDENDIVSDFRSRSSDF